MERHEGYFFLRISEDEARAFEVFELDDGWYWRARPHVIPPGDAVGAFKTSMEAYNDAMASPASRIIAQ